MKLKETLRKKTKGKKGFTLVELVIVIAVLAIIAAIAIPTVTNVINNANDAADKSNAQSIELMIKTAQSEAAAQDSVADSSRINTLSNATTKNMETFANAYGVDSSVFTLKVSGHHYIYNSTTGKVNATAAVAGTNEIVLSKSTNYTISNGIITFSNTTT